MTETKNSNAKKMLNKAADLVEEGWTQGHYTKDGCYCALGALGKAADLLEAKPFSQQSGAFGLAYDALEIAVFRQTDKKSIISWNDEPGQTQENVAKTIREAVNAV